VVLPYEVPQTGTRSNTITQLAINAFKNWNSNIALQWNPQASEFERADVNIQYKPAGDKVINLAYRFERGTIHPASQCNIDDATGTATNLLTAAQYSQAGICGFEQVELSGTWPIAGHWNAFGREVYSLQDKQALESFAGFEYGSCCWRVRFGARRYIGRSPGHRRVAAAGTHGSGKCRICVGYLPDRRDPWLHALGSELAKTIQGAIRAARLPPP
jgi:lipopolysaccharide assembly outer membrane protein LptD (OstA)